MRSATRKSSGDATSAEAAQPGRVGGDHAAGAQIGDDVAAGMEVGGGRIAELGDGVLQRRGAGDEQVDQRLVALVGGAHFGRAGAGLQRPRRDRHLERADLIGELAVGRRRAQRIGPRCRGVSASRSSPAASTASRLSATR